MIMSGGMAMSNYRAYKEKALQNPEVKTEYDALQAEYDIIQSLIDARANQNITQKELSLKTGIPQADISRIEKNFIIHILSNEEGNKSSMKL